MNKIAINDNLIRELVKDIRYKVLSNGSVWTIVPEKGFGISAKGHTISWKRIRAEVDKCILVCKNCHGEIHDELFQSSTIGRASLC